MKVPQPLEALMQAPNSVIASHAILRALMDRRMLTEPKHIDEYIALVAGDRDEAKSIAKQGIKIIADATKTPLADISDDVASGYIDWLSTFAVEREGRNSASPDLGKTLLVQLRLRR